MLWCFRWATCISCNLSCTKEHANWCPCSRSRHVRVSETTSLHLDNYVGPEVENGVTVCFVCRRTSQTSMRRADQLSVFVAMVLCNSQGKGTQINHINFIWPTSQVEASMVRRVSPCSCSVCSTSPLAVRTVYQKCKFLVVVTIQWSLLRCDTVCSGRRVTGAEENN